MTAEDRGAVSPADDGRGGPDLALLDALLDDLATVIHDRPVQQVVAAKLLLETGIPAEDRSAMVERGLSAITAAGSLSRDVMWALAGPHVRRERLGEDLQEMAARAASEDAPLETGVSGVEQVPLGLLTCMYRAVHNVLADAVLGGRHAHRVHLQAAGGALRATVEMDAPPETPDQRLWLRLAAARLADRGGSLRTLPVAADERDAGRRLVLLEVPLPADDD